MVHADDDGTGRQEQQGLEEGVRHQVEHGHGVGRSAQGHGHVTQLRQRGVRHHALDVVLDHAQDTHEEGSDGTNDQDEVQRCIAHLEQRGHARHHEDAGGHHGGRVDQCRNRRRAFHGIRQPGVQRELRRLAHGTDEQADGRHGHDLPAGTRHGLVGQRVDLAKEFGVVQRAGIGQQQADTQDEAEVTHAVDQERLHVGEDRRRTLVPEADQQVGHQAHCFPAKEQLHEVVAHHQHQHGEGEQRDVGEEAVVARITLHVANGVDVHHQGHRGHHHHHHGGQAVDHEADFHLQAADGQPVVQRLVVAGAVQHLHQHHHGQHAGHQHAANGQRVRGLVAQDAATDRRTEDAYQSGSQQRQKGNDDQGRCRKGRLCHVVITPSAR